MDPPIIMLDLTGRSRREGWLEPLAGGLLWCDQRLGPSAARAPRPACATLPEESALRSVYDGPGLVDGGMQRIRSFIAATGTRRVEFEDGESFRIAAAGDRIERVVADPDAPLGPLTIERVLGAPLALALGVRGIFLFHASALRGPRGVVALAGGSGSGKSTLAAAALSNADLALARIADDQLPVLLATSSHALPHFHQLKLAPGEGYAAATASMLPLVMVVELVHAANPENGVGSADVRLERLDPLEACLVLARATVAARLFDPALLAQHLRACATASTTLEVCRLHYPSGLDRLRGPLAALAERVARPGPGDQR